MSTENKKENFEKKSKPSKKLKEKEDDQNQQETDVDPEDYGGLPKRDIKKNLGCGG